MKQSAGILLYKVRDRKPEFFLVHPGGPFFVKKNEGWWSIPKGELLEDEHPLTAALREFKEETGYEPNEPYIELQPIVQKAGKKVNAWAAEGDLYSSRITSNTFEMIWPPKSGILKSFPEVDKAGWFDYETAATLINDRQADFLLQLMTILQQRRLI
jgi:predicted NUDIX family NTP pyrophosphohydrolase